ncbi:DUF3892 domain-containing protein [Halorubellus salinus]|uniref:DUF3892 domain-containing protein n=1 Tax=Halorubellus salinus TaxID=755309 RepID=UPI001D09921F|nr:DUF3892 domain-containing protein [Halorubellus salinus]
MASYEVACVSMDYDADVDDCRCIEEIGFTTRSGSIATRTPAEVHEMIAEDEKVIVVSYRGERFQLAAVERDGERYVRTADTDTAEDTLLKQPSC